MGNHLCGAQNNCHHSELISTINKTDYEMGKFLRLDFDCVGLRVRVLIFIVVTDNTIEEQLEYCKMFLACWRQPFIIRIEHHVSNDEVDNFIIDGESHG